MHKTLKKAVATAAIAGTLGIALFMSSVGTAVSGGETRTISLIHQHTKEKLTVTYKKNGNYVPSAMKQLNRFFRDWRRNEVTTIDPRTIDLVWELHADLGSKRPIHIVSGYRSPKTNAFLKRIGRNVAKKSQHMKGKAIDFFFPDVNTKTIRNSALARRVGGVGYYRSSGGPSGFLHADSGNVRHWGPKISRSELASIISQGRKTIGKRGGKKGVFDNAPNSAAEETVVAEAGTKKSGGIMGWLRGGKKKPAEAEVVEPTVVAANEPPVESIYSDDGDELADLSEDATAATAAEAKAAAAKARKKLPVVEEPAFVEAQPELPEGVAKKDRGALAALAGTAATEGQAEKRPSPVAASLGGFVPKPRIKPKAVMVMASADQQDPDMVIQPVSAPPEQGWSKKSNRVSPVADGLGTVEAADGLTEIEEAPTSTLDGKSNLDTDIRNASLNTDDYVKIQPVVATAAEPSWLSALYASAEASLRRDGVNPAPAAITSMPVPAILGPDGSGEIEVAAPVAAEGKGDALFVNREGKSSLPPIKLRLSAKQ